MQGPQAASQTIGRCTDCIPLVGPFQFDPTIGASEIFALLLVIATIIYACIVGQQLHILRRDMQLNLNPSLVWNALEMKLHWTIVSGSPAESDQEAMPRLRGTLVLINPGRVPIIIERLMYRFQKEEAESNRDIQPMTGTMASRSHIQTGSRIESLPYSLGPGEMAYVEVQEQAMMSHDWDPYSDQLQAIWFRYRSGYRTQILELSPHELELEVEYDGRNPFGGRYSPRSLRNRVREWFARAHRRLKSKPPKKD